LARIPYLIVSTGPAFEVHTHLIVGLDNVHHLADAPVVDGVLGVDVGIEHVFLLDVVVFRKEVLVLHITLLNYNDF